MTRADQLAADDKAVRDFALEGEISEAEIAAASAQGRKWFSLRRLRWGFSVSLSTNGYLVFPTWLGGLILQWGAVTTTATPASVSYPMGFPKALFYVTAEPDGQNSTSAREMTNVYSATLSGFLMDQAYVGLHRWFAIGY